MRGDRNARRPKCAALRPVDRAPAPRSPPPEAGDRGEARGRGHQVALQQRTARACAGHRMSPRAAGAQPRAGPPHTEQPEAVPGAPVPSSPPSRPGSTRRTPQLRPTSAHRWSAPQSRTPAHRAARGGTWGPCPLVSPKPAGLYATDPQLRPTQRPPPRPPSPDLPASTSRPAGATSTVSSQLTWTSTKRTAFRPQPSTHPRASSSAPAPPTPTRASWRSFPPPRWVTSTPSSSA